MNRTTAIRTMLGAAVALVAAHKAPSRDATAAPAPKCQLGCWANSGTKYCRGGDLYVYKCYYPCCDKTREPTECKWVVKYGVCGG